MAKIHEILVSSVLPAIKAVGKVEMENVLSNVKANNPPGVYLSTLQGLYSVFTLLKEEAVKSRTRIDDGIVDLVLDAVRESAANHNITLLRSEVFN